MTDTFTFRGRELTYLDHPYNATRLNERAVEVPIAEAWLQEAARQECAGQRSLHQGVEIGNVLWNYGMHPPVWPTLDRDEIGEWITNEDVRTWEPNGSLDAVVSISTFEHVGQDEGRWEDAWPAIERVADMLAPDGSMLVTIGLGQSPHLDEILLSSVQPANSRLTTAHTLVRDDLTTNEWRTTIGLETRPYIGHSGQGAGAVWVGQFGRPLL